MQEGKQPVLSISVLFSGKNSEIQKKCLASVRELTQQIDCEFVAVDTGCCGEILEQVRAIADRVITFEWCRDFSAARNAGLLACNGEWFLYLDDDEWFDDTAEIVSFFRSGDYRDYDGAWYLQRNYDSFDGTSYSDAYAGRMCKRTSDTRFCGKIHEYMTPLPLKIKKLSAFVHHYGYVYQNEQEKQEHALRNITLAEAELSEHPQDIRMGCQLVQEYWGIGRLAEAEALTVRLLAETKNMRNNSYVQYLLCHLPGIRRDREKWDEALAAADAAENEQILYAITRLTLNYEKAVIYGQSGRDAEMLAELVRFVELWEKKEEHTNENPVMDFAYYLSERAFSEAVRMGIQAMLRAKDYSNAYFFFGRVDWNFTNPDTGLYIQCLLEVSRETGEDALLTDCLSAILLDENNMEAVETLRALCGEQFWKSAERKEEENSRKPEGADGAKYDVKPGNVSENAIACLRAKEKSVCLESYLCQMDVKNSSVQTVRGVLREMAEQAVLACRYLYKNEVPSLLYSRRERFAFCFLEAEDAKEFRTWAGKISEAAGLYPRLLPALQVLLEEKKRKQNENAELAALSEQMRRLVTEKLDAGLTEEAIALVIEVSKILKEEPWVKELLAIIEGEETNGADL